MGAVREKIEQGTGGTQEESQAWPDSSFRTKTRSMPKKRAATSFEQVELWPTENVPQAELPAPAEPVVLTTAISPSEPMEDVHYVDVKKLRKPAPRVVTAERRKVVGSSGVKAAPHTSQSLRVNAIARFLNVNGAIEGLKTGGIHFDVSGRGGLQPLRLWKGTTETSAFLSAP